MLSDFSVVETLHRGTWIEVTRCTRRSDGMPVVVKTSQRRAALLHEHATLQALRRQGVTAVPEPLALVESADGAALVLRDDGGYALGVLMQHERMDVATVLRVAQQLCVALAQVHSAGVLHRDINPRHVVYNRAQNRVQLIDLTLATAPGHALHGPTCAGTLAYAAPECTGRIQRATSTRSDFYSVGALLYELLVGRAPFAGLQGEALIEAILTQPPEPIARSVPQVPAALAQIIDKLLHKNMDARYHSAQGIERDLQRCVALMQAGCPGETFPLGDKEDTALWTLPHTLYGRDAAIAALQDAYEQAMQRGSATVLVRGAAGLGKSSLVAALQTRVAARRGLFVGGKFDPLHRHVPFLAFAQAMDAVVQRVLCEPAAAQQAWRERMQAALGTMGQALINIAPALHQLVGPQPALPELPPTQTENRLLYVLQRFMRSLCAQGPLVLLMDDVQWADRGTLKLMRMLANDTQCAHGLLVVAAYRDAEVSETHPLHTTLAAIKDSGAVLTPIDLTPLSVDHIAQLLADATHTTPTQTHPWARWMHGTTAGNPLFVRQVLTTLRRRGLLHHADGAWQWNVQAMHAITLPNDVAAWINDNLAALPQEAQTLLATAACVGNTFALGDVTAVLKQDPGAALQALLQAGVIVGLAQDTYRFVHDRVQQAAYAMLSHRETETTHHLLGERLLNQHGARGGVALFQLLEHFGHAHAAITDTPQRLLLAELNIRGARVAKQAAAYGVAETYLQRCVTLLGPQSWQNHYGIWRAWMVESIDCAYRLEDVPRADALLQEGLRQATEPLDRAEMLLRRMGWLQAHSDHAQVNSVAAQALAQLQVPIYVAEARALQRLIAALRGRTIEALADAPETTDATVLKMLEILAVAAYSAYFTDAPLFAVITLTMAQVSATHGLSPWSAFAYAGAAAWFGGQGDYGTSKRWSTAAWGAMQKLPSSLDGRTACINMVFNGYADMRPWDLIDAYLHASDQALSHGDAVYGAMGGVLAGSMMLHMSVEETQSTLPRFIDTYALKNSELAVSFRHMEQLCKQLQGYTVTATDWSDVEVSDEAFQAELPALSAAAQITYWYLKLLGVWRHDGLEDAMDIAERGMASGMIEMGAGQTAVFFSYITCLAVLRHAHAHGGEVARPQLLKRAYKALRGRVLGQAPRHEGMLHLVDAEMASLSGNHDRALVLYERAIAAQTALGLVVLVAEAWECLARHHLRRDMHRFAAQAAQEACTAYQRWGGSLKVKQLQHTFAAVLAPQPSVVGLPRHVDLAALMTAVQTLGNARHAEDLCSRVVHAVLPLTGATRAVLLGRQPQDTYTVLHDTDPSAPPVPHAVVAMARHNREATTLEWQGNLAKSLAAAPLLAQGEVRGVLCVMDTQAAGTFTAEVLAALQVVASQAALALDNLQCHQAMEDHVRGRTETLRHDHAVALEVQRQSAGMDIAGTFAHEMRQALVPAARGLVVLQDPDQPAGTLLHALRLDVQNRTDSDALHDALRALDEMVQQVRVAVERGIRITELTLNYAQATQLRPSPDTTALQPVLQQLLQEFASTLSAENISVVVQSDGAQHMTMGRDHCYTVLRNFVSNARDSLRGKAGGDKRIWIRSEVAHQGLLLSVQDNGMGMAPHVQEKVFQPFFSSKGGQNSGLGLGLSRQIAAVYGGKIEFETEHEHGTTFTLFVPDPPR